MAKKRRAPPLTVPEIRFCQFWIETDNATQAYIDSHKFAGERESASTLAARLLRKVEIKKYVEYLTEEAAEVVRETVNRLARSLSWQAHADRTKVFDRQGRMKLPHLWPEEVRAIISGVEVDNIEEWTGEGDDRKKEVIGVRWKVRFERSIEAKKILAQWRKMIGSDEKPVQNTGNTQLVIIRGPKEVPLPVEPEALPESPGG